MTRLFNEYDAWTDDARRLSDEVAPVIRPIIDKWLSNGYDGRDVEAVILSTVMGNTAAKILRRATERRKFMRETVKGLQRY